MQRLKRILLLFAVMSIFACANSLGQAPASPVAATQKPSGQMLPAERVAAQQEAMAKLSWMDGIWRGSGSMIDNPGETPRQMRETLRIGSFLDGTVKIVEIRGYLSDGKLGFHALNMISFNALTKQFEMTARAGGLSGVFPFRLADSGTGYLWSLGSGDGIHYTGTLKDGVWHELGESGGKSRPTTWMSEMTVRRVSATEWPEAGAILPE